MIYSLKNMALTREEIAKRHYRRRKENGQCPRCGKELDRAGHYCTECLEKQREYTRSIRKFSKLNGLCPECGKEKLFGNEKQCTTCRTKREERRKPLTEEQKEKYGDAFKARQKELREQRKAQGICTRCGKRRAALGRKKCELCLKKDAEIHSKKILQRPNIKEYRKENKLCYFCGEPAEEHKNVCAKCSERCRQDRLRAKTNNKHWRADNKLIFKN